MSSKVDLSKRCLVFITGASQGIGQTIAVELSKLTVEHCMFVLIARSEKGLNDTRNQVAQINKDIITQICPLDLSKATKDDCQQIFQKVLGFGHVDTALFFHNAGQVGTLKKATELDDVNVWKEYFYLNYFSVVLLNSMFIETMRSLASKLVIINITSLCGRQPFANMAMYGSGKAARDLYFKVLAVEEPDFAVLNYSPGPVDTEMFNSVIQNADSVDLKKSFSEMKEQKVVLSTEQTVKKLMMILENGAFKSGDTVDYFDRE